MQRYIKVKNENKTTVFRQLCEKHTSVFIKVYMSPQKLRVHFHQGSVYSYIGSTEEDNW